MPLSISFISRFEDVLEPARAFLSRDGDLFAKPRIVVPTAGAKAWLWSELAKTLGASRGDGIVANVEISYPGTILALLQPPRGREPDPWDFDRLTFTVLDVITGPAAAALGLPIEIGREPLSTARRIAGLFDEYHVRRPGMILEWERPEENPVLEPTANDVQHDGSAVPASLRDGDRWQFRLWREVRRRIGQPSPPARRGVEHDQSRQPLLIAGLQSLTLPQFECLEPLAAVCPVEAWLVHPSPGLRSRWSSAGQQPLPEDLRTRPLQKRRDPVFPAGVDPLLPVWLAGACELQDLLTARGAKVVEPLSAGDAAKGPAASLLHRLQRTIADGGRPEPLEHDPARDRSLLIHRCHSLSRQAEVLHDALLQAFADIPHLEPHDVVIVSPCLEKAAPHLQAVFQRTVRGLGRDDEPRSVKLPLVIADRGLRDTSPAAELLTALLAIPGSRASVDDVLTVAGHPLVRLAFAIDDDTVATWAAFVERTAVRWGLDSAHRRRHGLDLRHNTEIHTWRLGLERMLLGATLPDAAARPELGGVVPLEDLETADLARITKLVRILDILHGLEAAAVGSQPAAAWCDVIEQALVDLCGEECPQLAEPLAHLRRLRQAAAGTAGGRVSVPFADVRVLLTTWLDETTGRQPLRTGAITATSMVPLRSVPFKVICVMGYDDGTVAAGEADGDDLVGRQQLVGDVDPRVDVRRALLDCVVAAGARLVITCNGRNARSNKRVPLVTPLAE
ncbi:MAG: exodeoxyribonuclease subunit gamma, partial [Planctomycetota bacterium]